MRGEDGSRRERQQHSTGEFTCHSHRTFTFNFIPRLMEPKRTFSPFRVFVCVDVSLPLPTVTVAWSAVFFFFRLCSISIDYWVARSTRARVFHSFPSANGKDIIY